MMGTEEREWPRRKQHECFMWRVPLAAVRMLSVPIEVEGIPPFFTGHPLSLKFQVRCPGPLVIFDFEVIKLLL